MTMIAQSFRYTENHCIVHLKWVNFMFHKLYFKKVVESLKQGRREGFRAGGFCVLGGKAMDSSGPQL